MMNFFSGSQYCYTYAMEQIPVGLLLYSHIPTALLSLLFATYVLYKVRKLSGFTLFVTCLFFSLWCIFDLMSWFNFDSSVTMFTWGLVDLFSLIFFFFSYYFFYTFVTNKDLPIWQKIIGMLIILPTALWTLFGSNLISFEANYCEAIESEIVTNYLFTAEAIFIMITLLSMLRFYRLSKSAEKQKVVLAGTGVLIFLSLFFSATLTSSILVDIEQYAEYAYNYEIYGLFGMPVLLIYLGYLIVKHSAFNLKIFSTQALVVTLIALIGSQFFFIQNLANGVLNGIALLIVIILGRFLIRSVKREIEARQEVEKLAKDLEKANVRLKALDKEKTEFVSLASHQLRAPMTAIKGYISMIFEGDYGKVPEGLMDPIKRIFSSTQSLVQIVGDFLDVSRIELGTMKFNFIGFDMKKLVQDIAEELKPNIEISKLEFKMDLPKEDCPFFGDATKLKQVFNNLIDNSLKYTKQGFVHVSLENKGDKFVFKVNDSGIGMDPRLIPKLFDKFSRADNANEANVIGTGLGLFVAKQMVEKHGGKIWAESDGEGKGSTFVVETPIKN